MQLENPWLTKRRAIFTFSLDLRSELEKNLPWGLDLRIVNENLFRLSADMIVEGDLLPPEFACCEGYAYRCEPVIVTVLHHTGAKSYSILWLESEITLEKLAE